MRLNIHPISFHLQIYFKNQTPAPGTSHPAHLPLTDVLALVIDSFTSATERHIEVSLFGVLLYGPPRLILVWLPF